MTTQTGPLADGNVRFGKIEIINQAASLDLSPLGPGSHRPADRAGKLPPEGGLLAPAGSPRRRDKPGHHWRQGEDLQPVRGGRPGERLAMRLRGGAYGIFSSQANAPKARLRAIRFTAYQQRPVPWSVNAGCPLNAAATVRHHRTALGPSTFLVAQRSFSPLPADAGNLTTYISVDNDARASPRWRGDHRICCAAGRLAARLWRGAPGRRDLLGSASSSSTRAARRRPSTV